MAWIGEKPATRSGPYSLIVYAFAAAISSAASSQPTLTKPPRPRFDTQSRRFSGSCTMDRQAATGAIVRSEEHTSELQSLMRISYAVFCLKKKKTVKQLIDNRIANTTSQHNHQTDTRHLQHHYYYVKRSDMKHIQHRNR